MLRLFLAVLFIHATAVAALVSGSQRTIITGASNNGFPDFAAAPFRANMVAGSFKAANLFGATEVLNGGLSVEGCSTLGLSWLSPLNSPATANSGSAVNFSGPSDFAARNRIGNTGFHGTQGWSLRFNGLTPGAKYRVQLLNAEGFAAGPAGRNFDITVDGTLAFDNFNPPGAGELPLAGIAQFEAVAEAGGTITVLFTVGSSTTSPDTNPYVNAVAIARVDATAAGITDGLVGHWRFDDAGSTVTNSFGASGGGTLTGFAPAPWVAGRIGGALDFDGVNDWVRVASYAKPTERMTLAMWVWADTRPTWASFAKNWGAGGGQFHFGLDSGSGQMSTYIIGSVSGFGPAIESTTFPVGAWQHVAMTCDGATVRIYRNGVRVGSTIAYSGVLSDLIGPFAFGVKTDSTGAAPEIGSPGFWDGKIDDAGLWTRALSDQEIYGIYTAGLSGQDLEQAGPGTPPAGIVAINEFMASNSGGLEDEDGSSSDWVEIYNGLDTPANMAGWRLTDDPANLSKWTFPATTIPARSFLVVFASGKNRAVAGQPLHTNFQLAGSGEYLALVNPGGQIVSAYQPAPQAANVSFGVSRPITDQEPPGSAAFNALLRYFQFPTPGAPNIGGTEALGPTITQLAHTPVLPGDADNIVVTARVAATFAPVAGVTMKYRVMFGAEQTLAMFDDGAHGDGAAGDGVFGATIPASASTPGQMVRYYVTAADTGAKTSRSPLFIDPTASEEYQGTVITDPAIVTTQPVLHWFVQNAAAAETDAGTLCSVFFRGELYDNIDVRIRGGTSRSWPKKSYKLKFNDGHHFAFSDGANRVDEINLNTTYTDKSYVRSVLASESQRDAGLPSPETFHVHVRQNALFYSVAFFVEQIDKDFLDRWDVPKSGALYKGGPGSNYESVTSFEKKTRTDEDSSDVQSLLTNLGLTGTPLETYVFDNLDVASLVNYIATVAIAQNIDASDKNHFLYRDTEGTREWRVFPYDLDLTFGPNALNTDTIVFNQQDTVAPACASHPFIGARPWMLHGGKYNRLLEAVVNTPRTRTMLLRRIRTLTDAQLGTAYFQNRINALIAAIGPDVTLDMAKWGANGYFPGANYTLQQANDRIKTEYLTPRVGFLTGAGIVDVGAANPAAQPANAVLTITALDFNPAGGQTQEFVELTNPNAYAVDLTGWQIAGEVAYPIKPGTVIPAGEKAYLSPDPFAFRSRAAAPTGGQRAFVVGPYPGQLSARGGTVTLLNPALTIVSTFNYTGVPTTAQQGLRVTEVMFRPAPPAAGPYLSKDFEFIELRNIGATTLNLTGVRVAGGIDFDFTGSAITNLAPDAYVLIVSNAAAFASRYGAGLPVAGQFAGNLSDDNLDERIHIIDAVGESVLDFKYQPAWIAVTNGAGFSLTIVDETAPHTAWDFATGWRASNRLHGTPGTGDPAAFDTDGDGIPDLWEAEHALQPATPDATLDPDGDGANNLAEYLAGTDPHNAASFFRVTSVGTAPGAAFRITFTAAAARTYAIQRGNDLATWTTINTEPAGAARIVTFDDAPGGTKQYYRVVTPAP